METQKTFRWNIPFFLFFIFLINFNLQSIESYAVTPVSLVDSFQAGIQKSELISSQDQEILQAQERVSQAKGSFLPTLSASGTYFVQQSPSDPLTQSFFPSSQPTAKLTLSQPIFRGLREFDGLRKLNRLEEAQKYTKDATLLQLYNEVCINFFRLLSFEEEIQNLQTQLKLYEDRIDELKERTRTGQSSAAEELAARAAQSVVQAQLKQITGQYKSTWEGFSFLTGFTTDTPLKYADNPDPKKQTLPEYLTALEQRPDIKAAKELVDAAEDAVAVARGAHLPTVDFLGNYFLIRPSGVFSEIRWDIQATVTIPIFSGGTVQSKVNETASQRTQAELQASRTKKLAEQEIRSLYESYQSDLEQINALEESMNLSEKSYLVLKKEYSKGLTRNLDVLQALTQFQESKRALGRARWTLKSNWNRLQTLSALRPLPELRK